MGIEIDFSKCTCANCQMPFLIQTVFYNRLQECHNTFYCPNGHSNYFPQSTQMEREIKLLKSQNNNLITEIIELKNKKNKKKRKEEN